MYKLKKICNITPPCFSPFKHSTYMLKYIRVWKLKDEETHRYDDVAKADGIQKKWILMKETWLKGTKHVCGMTKSPPRHKETWWWNRDVEEVVPK